MGRREEVSQLGTRGDYRVVKGERVSEGLRNRNK